MIISTWNAIVDIFKFIKQIILRIIGKIQELLRRIGIKIGKSIHVFKNTDEMIKKFEKAYATYPDDVKKLNLKLDVGNKGYLNTIAGTVNSYSENDQMVRLIDDDFFDLVIKSSELDDLMEEMYEVSFGTSALRIDENIDIGNPDSIAKLYKAINKEEVIIRKHIEKIKSKSNLVKYNEMTIGRHKLEVGDNNENIILSTELIQINANAIITNLFAFHFFFVKLEKVINNGKIYRNDVSLNLQRAADKLKYLIIEIDRQINKHDESGTEDIEGIKSFKEVITKYASTIASGVDIIIGVFEHYEDLVAIGIDLHKIFNDNDLLYDKYNKNNEFLKNNAYTG